MLNKIMAVCSAVYPKLHWTENYGGCYGEIRTDVNQKAPVMLFLHGLLDPAVGEQYQYVVGKLYGNSYLYERGGSESLFAALAAASRENDALAPNTEFGLDMQELFRLAKAHVTDLETELV